MISKVIPAQNSPSFGWINISECKNLENRLNRDKISKLKELVTAHKTNPIEVKITDMPNSSKRFEAALIPSVNMLYVGSKKIGRKDYKETIFEAFGSPLNFIERMANYADKMNSEYAKRKILKEQLKEIKKINDII